MGFRFQLYDCWTVKRCKISQIHLQNQTENYLRNRVIKITHYTSVYRLYMIALYLEYTLDMQCRNITSRSLIIARLSESNKTTAKFTVCNISYLCLLFHRF